MKYVSGVLLVILSMAAILVEGMFSEQLATYASNGQIIVFPGLGCALFFVVWALFAKQEKTVPNSGTGCVSGNMRCLLFVRWC